MLQHNKFHYYQNLYQMLRHVFQKIRILNVEKDEKEGNLLYVCGPTIKPVIGCNIIATQEGIGQALVFGERAIFKDEAENEYYMVVSGVIKPVDIFVLISSGVFTLGTRVYLSVNKDDLELKDKSQESNFDKLATNLLAQKEEVKTEEKVEDKKDDIKAIVEDALIKEEKK
jgi:hypothetical protein